MLLVAKALTVETWTMLHRMTSSRERRGSKAVRITEGDSLGTARLTEEAVLVLSSVEMGK